MYYPKTVTKGVAFRLYFSFKGTTYNFSSNTAWQASYPAVGSIASAAWTISKDGSAPASLTNAPVQIAGTSMGYVDLTADEMNADVVAFYGIKQLLVGEVIYGASITDVIILTSSGSSEQLSAEDVWSYESRTLTHPVRLDLDEVVPNASSISETNPSIGEVLSIIWLALTKTAGKNLWTSDFEKWIRKFN